MTKLTEKDLTALSIEDIAKFKVLKMFESKSGITEEELYDIRDNFEDNFLAKNKTLNATKILLLNAHSIENMWEKEHDIFGHADAILNSNLMDYMENFLEVAMEVYKERFEELEPDLYDEYEMDPDELVVYFEDVVDQIENELHFELDYDNMQEKINALSKNLSPEQKEIINMKLSKIGKEYGEKDLENILDDTTSRLILLNNLNKATDVYLKLVEQGKDINVLEEPQKLCLAMIKENQKELTLDEIIQAAQQKMEKSNTKKENRELER